MVAVTAVVADRHSSYEASVARFAEQLTIGSFAGVAGGLALIAALRVTGERGGAGRGGAVLVAAVLLGALTATLHGSGFLAVYVAGLLLSDRWNTQRPGRRAVPAALSAVAEPLLFVALGAAFAPLITLDDLLRGVALTLATVLVVRPVVASVCLFGSGLSRALTARALISWGVASSAGAVPALLLAGYPELERLSAATSVAATVLVATAASLVLQGGTLPLVAARVARREP